MSVAHNARLAGRLKKIVPLSKMYAVLVFQALVGLHNDIVVLAPINSDI